MSKNKANRFRWRSWNPHVKRMERAEDNIDLYHEMDGTFHMWYDQIDVSKEVVVMYSTGTLDSEGKEVYEGDIVTSGEYPFMDDGKQNYVGIVEWFDCSFCLTLRCVNNDKRGISDGITETIEDSKSLTVIGNIYENADLLDKK